MEVLDSAFVVEKRGGRWCLIHFDSGIMHERNFPHKAMAKQFGMELTIEGYVPEGAAKVAEMLADEGKIKTDETAEKTVSVPPPVEEVFEVAPPKIKRRKRRKKRK